MAWYGTPGWGYRLPLTIDADQVSATLTDFPVLVSITSTSLRDNAQADGDDILFTSADGSTKLAHEIESYDNSTGTLVAWVKVPSLSGSVDTTLYLYYGNSGAGDQSDAANVWDSNFVGVWHLAEDPSGSAPQMLDSSGNANHGTSAGSMTSDDLVSAQVGDGLDFDGSDDYIETASIATLDSSTFTLSTWLKPVSISGTYWVAAQYDTQGVILFQIDDELAFQVGFSSDRLTTATSPLSQDTWYYAVGTRNGNDLELYIDGASVLSDTKTPNASSAAAFTISSGGNPFNGSLDEVRISSVARSADWIATEYANQNAPGTFMSVGDAQASGTLTPGHTYQHRNWHHHHVSFSA